MSEDGDRQLLLQQITKKLVLFTAGVLLAVAILIYCLIGNGHKISILVVLVFVCGLLGGFVSIQQRLPNISLNEMRALTRSWFSITLIPINGGIFAMVLMLAFIGHIVQGALFPAYPVLQVSNTDEFYNWISNGYPTSGMEIGKLLFWSFVAGFSERLVPQVIRKVTDQVKVTKDDN